jgi:hypothetical protein
VVENRTPRIDQPIRALEIGVKGERLSDQFEEYTKPSEAIQIQTTNSLRQIVSTVIHWLNRRGTDRSGSAKDASALYLEDLQGTRQTDRSQEIWPPAKNRPPQFEASQINHLAQDQGSQVKNNNLVEGFSSKTTPSFSRIANEPPAKEVNFWPPLPEQSWTGKPDSGPTFPTPIAVPNGRKNRNVGQHHPAVDWHSLTGQSIPADFWPALPKTYLDEKVTDKGNETEIDERRLRLDSEQRGPEWNE